MLEKYILMRTTPEYEKGYKKGRTDAIEKMRKILEDELVLAHTTTSGKTSRLTSALNRLNSLD